MRWAIVSSHIGRQLGPAAKCEHWQPRGGRIKSWLWPGPVSPPCMLSPPERAPAPVPQVLLLASASVLSHSIPSCWPILAAPSTTVQGSPRPVQSGRSRLRAIHLRPPALQPGQPASQLLLSSDNPTFLRRPQPRPLPQPASRLVPSCPGPLPAARTLLRRRLPCPPSRTALPCLNDAPLPSASTLGTFGHSLGHHYTSPFRPSACVPNVGKPVIKLLRKPLRRCRICARFASCPCLHDFGIGSLIPKGCEQGILDLLNPALVDDFGPLQLGARRCPRERRGRVL